LCVTSAPSITTRPLFTGSSPAIIRSAVVLPELSHRRARLGHALTPRQATLVSGWLGELPRAFKTSRCAQESGCMADLVLGAGLLIPVDAADFDQLTALRRSDAQRPSGRRS